MTTRRLPSDPTAAATARGVVADELAQELGDLYGDSLRDDALLLTSELVTNAVLHATTGVELSVVTGHDALHVEVSDGDPALPEPRVADVEDLGGRGLALVAALASDWGVKLAPPGKVVWFELPLPKGRRVRRAPD